MLAGLIIFFQGIEDDLEMFFSSQEIRIGRINKKRFDAVLLDIAGIGFLQVKQVIVRNGLLIGPVPFPDIFLKLKDRRVQVDQQVGLNELLVNDFEEFLIEMKLFKRKIYFSKKKAFGKYIIGDRDTLKKILGVNQFFELFIAFCHKKKFERKSVLFWILVEFGQKGIFGKSFQDQAGVKMPGQQVGKCGFTCSDISFHGNKMIIHEL